MAASTENAPSLEGSHHSETNLSRKGSEVKLKRELGLFSAVNLILAVMIGSGIFVSPSSALYHAGSVGFCVVVWAVSGFISFLGALSFAELGTVVNKSGAEYTYFYEAFGKLHKFWGPLPSFICAWVYILILRPAEVAIVVMTFAEYTIQPLASVIDLEALSDDKRHALIKLVSLLALSVMTYINMSSVKLFVKIQNIFGPFKIVVCAIIIFGGLYELFKGNTENISQGFQGTNTDVKSIALAFYSGLWAYDGWNAVTIVTEEIIDPGRNIPLSIAVAVPLITGLYVMMNVAYMTVLSIPQMVSVPAVAVAFGNQVLGPVSFIIPLGVVIATFGCAMSVQFGVTRVCFVAAREGHMVGAFSFIHTQRMTPAPAVAFQGLLTFLFIVVGNIGALIEFASFLLWLFYGCAMVALIVLRRTQPDTPRPYKVPIILPYFVLFASIFLAFVPIVTDPSPKYLFAVGFILFGILVYTVLVYKKKTPRFMNKVTEYIQILFQSVPTNKEQ